MSYDLSIFNAELPIGSAQKRGLRQWTEQLATSIEALAHAIQRGAHSPDVVRSFLRGDTPATQR